MCAIDAGLVVGGAAAVEAVAAHGRLERRRVPVVVVAGRLHVVVGVEQDGRPAVAGRARREHGGLPELVGAAGSAARDDLDALEDAESRERARRRPRRCARTWAGSKPSQETDGMRTRFDEVGDRGGEAGLHAPRGAHRRVGWSSDGHAGRVMRVILSRHRQRGLTVAKTPARTGTQADADRPTTAVAAGKGAPTPTRKEQEAARKRPLVPTRPQAGRAPVARPGRRRSARGPASAWPPATRSTCPSATRARRSATCATTSTRGSASARCCCRSWCS